MEHPDEAIIDGVSHGRFFGKLADPAVTGQLIEDAGRRQQWLELVQALQLASESEHGPLKGWVFHGSYGSSIGMIESLGLEMTHARIVEPGSSDLETRGNHFGSANVAAFFAEDGIESLEEQDIELAIFAVPMESLRRLGDFRADAYMIETPLTSRLRSSENVVNAKVDAGIESWEDCWQTLETVVVLADVPPDELVCLRQPGDVLNLIDRLREESSASSRLRRP